MIWHRRVKGLGVAEDGVAGIGILKPASSYPKKMPFTDQDKRDVMEYGEHQYNKGHLAGVYDGYTKGYAEAKEEAHEDVKEARSSGYRKGLLHGLLIGTIGLFLGAIWCDSTSRPQRRA